MDSKHIKWGIGSYCSEFQTIYNSWTTKPNDTYANYWNTMVQSLVTPGYWTRMDFFHFEAVHINSALEAYKNWRNPGTFDLSDPGSTNPTFTAYEGFTGDGSSDYLSLNFNPSINGVNLVQDDATIGVYNRVTLTGSTNYIIGAGNDAPDLWLALRPYYGTGLRVILNDDYAGRWEPDPASPQGLVIMTRNGSTLDAYSNGSSIGTTSNASAGVVNANLLLLAYLYNSSPSAFINAQVSCDFGMDGINSTEAAEITNIIETCMDSMGKGVIV